MIIAIAIGIVGDMGIKKPQLTTLRASIRFTDIYLTVTNGFDLAAGKNDTSLNALMNIIIMISFSVEANRLYRHELF